MTDERQDPPQQYRWGDFTGTTEDMLKEVLRGVTGGITTLATRIEELEDAVRKLSAEHDIVSAVASRAEADAAAYVLLRDTVIELFNPRDDDASEESIMVDALKQAAAFIEEQLCHCTQDVRPPDWETPCPRCMALGRRLNIREER